MSARLSERLAAIGAEVRDEFVRNRRVLSFQEYLDVVAESPRQHLRGSAQYLADLFAFYGEEEVPHPRGSIRRFRLFDAPWDGGRRRLAGQEEAQNRIHAILQNFVRQRRVDRLILLHGPNGSSKSTIIETIARAMEDYSGRDEGVLYRFNWIFPRHGDKRQGIGFGGGGGRQDPASYAHLDDADIDTRIPCELRDHPLLLLPRPVRAQLLEELSERCDGDGAFQYPDYLVRGDLSHKNKRIFEALLSAYEGDYLRVLRHVQVERFYVSRRYRAATARVEPQLAVDARLRQITADRSLSNLPSALQSLALYEVQGELADANRGIIDYADLLKRPPETYKYLLSAVENGRVALSEGNLYLDVVFLASANEDTLNAFMASGEWTSFKARLDLVRVPYLRDHRVERTIYDLQLEEGAPARRVAPHATSVAAMWAVLTRLRRPDPKRYDGRLRELVANLTPLDKARLYAGGELPPGTADEDAKLLRGAAADLYDETANAIDYEGRTGASPRELKTLLLNAAQRADFAILSPSAVLAEVEQLVREASVYPFLRQEPEERGFRDHAALVGVVRGWWLDIADGEVRQAMGLVEEASYLELFQRYVTHVTHHVRKEQVRNPMTGRFEDPDAALMERVEEELDVGDDAEAFRQGIMTRIGAWSVDNPGERPDYEAIFGEHIERLRATTHERQRGRASRILRAALELMAGEDGALEEEIRASAEGMLARLRAEYGYDDASLTETLTLLYRDRYAD